MPPQAFAPWAGLIDDAAVFPPGNATVAAAVAAHEGYRAASYGHVVGPLVLPVDAVGKALDAARAPLDLIAIEPTGAGSLRSVHDRLTADSRVSLHGLELRLAGDDLAANAARVVVALIDLPDQLRIAVELPRSTDVAAAAGHLRALDELAAEERVVAKYRTGGDTAEAFPDATELAAFIDACLDRELPFKLTAGLHCAVRYDDSGTGFACHGFLNVVLATCTLLDGGSRADAARVLDERDGSVLVDVARTNPDALVRARRAFRSIGSCSVLEPVADLHRLGLLSNAAGA